MLNDILKPSNDYDPIISSNTVLLTKVISKPEDEKYLVKDNYLSEYDSEVGKKKVRDNLDVYSKDGIDSLFNTIKGETDEAVLDISNLSLIILLNESERLQSEEYRIANEQIRLTNELTRELNESTRIQNESTRVTKELDRITKELLRILNESQRLSNEQNRISAETTRVSEENNRNTLELLRISKELERIVSEQDRITNESERLKEEEKRIESETLRTIKENLRTDSESSRVSAEQGRVSAEQSRVTAEESRATAEQQRVTKFATLKQDAETATDNANTAAGKANEATSGLESYKNTTDIISNALGIADKTEITELYNQGYYRNLVGNIIGGSTYIISKAFQVKKGDLIRVLVKGTSNVAYVSEVTSDQSFVRMLLGSITCSNFTEFRLIADRDMYIEACSNTISASGYIFEVYSWALGLDLAQPGGPCRQLYEAAGAVYNEETGYYELNGLTDITETEMGTIYNESISLQNFIFINKAQYAGSKFRTNIVNKSPYTINNKSVNFSETFRDCINLEVLSFKCSTNLPPKLTSVSTCFYNCPKLKKVDIELDVSSVYSFSLSFGGCKKLETIILKNISKNISLSDSPLLSKDSILHMIENSAATSAITITLHPDAYAMAMADEDIQAALAEKTFVSLASA